MRVVHAMLRFAVRVARSMRRASAIRIAARGLPAPAGEPAAIARTLLAHASVNTTGTVDRSVDEWCGAALAHHPGDAALTAAAARWYLVTGRPDQAVLVCENAFGHNAAGVQHDWGVQSAWGEALLGLDRAREAVWRFEAACATGLATAEDWEQLARACCRCGRYEEALESGERAAGAAWRRPEAADRALATMATARYCLGQMAEAEGILLELLGRAPHHAEAGTLLNKVRNFQGKGMRHDA